MGVKRTAWHFLFAILLRRYGPRCFEIRDEVPLSEEPMRMDYLLIQRTSEPSDTDKAETLRKLWPLLPRVTIAELKTVGRPYERGNLDRLWSYAHAYHATEHKSVGGRRNLAALLIAPNRTPSLDADAKEMGLAWIGIHDGYWRLDGGLFTLYVVEIDVVADQQDEDLLTLYSHSDKRTPRAAMLWSDLVGAEAKMEMRELEGFDEVLDKFLADLPLEQVLGRYSPEQRLAGLPPEQRLAGLTPEQALLALPDEVLRTFPDAYVATLPEGVRAAIRKRIGRA